MLTVDTQRRLRAVRIMRSMDVPLCEAKSIARKYQKIKQLGALLNALNKDGGRVGKLYQ